jgi:hypothetical protein
MRDPGDGSIHQAANLSVLKYAGDDLWSYEEDAYNPMNFLPMVASTSSGVRRSAPSATMRSRSRRT